MICPILRKKRRVLFALLIFIIGLCFPCFILLSWLNVSQIETLVDLVTRNSTFIPEELGIDNIPLIRSNGTIGADSDAEIRHRRDFIQEVECAQALINF